MALRIPKSFAIETNVEQGSTVDVTLEKGKIVVRPVAESKFTLAELLSKVTKSNIHQETNLGSPVGKETW